jgi:hypothetical protein
MKQKNNNMSDTGNIIFVAYLYNGTLGYDTKRSIHLAIRVFLYPYYVEIESALQFRMSNMGLGEPKTSGPDETFILWRLSGETGSHK